MGPSLKGDLFRERGDLGACVNFHGHLCPGLVYGYRVAGEAMQRLGLSRSEDEETVVISENDSCAVDAFQVILGATIGKGNLLLRDYGKNAYTVFDRGTGRALRFIRRKAYAYGGEEKAEYAALEKRMNDGIATLDDLKRQKYLKALDLLESPFSDLYDTEEIDAPVMPPYAALAPSLPCDRCGEMTMASRLITTSDGERRCPVCAETKGPS
ncbi:MAG: formylmethanofuran dehydrogenase [Deltaproteobacteria bacterium]|nr:formylmethanofuran dehydrogenase [Deltaproteobacteria bacterium]